MLVDFVAKFVEGPADSFDRIIDMHYRLMSGIVLGEKLDWSKLLYKRIAKEVYGLARCSDHVEELWYLINVYFSYVWSGIQRAKKYYTLSKVHY